MSGPSSFQLLVLLSLLAPAAAYAKGTAEQRCGDRHLKLYSGVALTENSDLEIRRPAGLLDVTIRDVTWEDYSLSAPSAPYIGVRAGCFSARRPWLGVALDFIHFKVFAETHRTVRIDGIVGGAPLDQRVTMNQIVQRYDVGNGVNMLLVSGVARARLRRDGDFPEGRLRPYAGLGAGPSILYTQSTVSGEERGGYELGRLGAQAALGIEYRISRRWDTFAEYKRTYTRANGSIAGGDSETTLETDHFVVGVGWRF